MPSTNSNIDLKALAESLRSNISRLGGFSPQQVRQDASLDDQAVQRLVLLTLQDEPLGGAQILENLRASVLPSKRLSAADVYPALEALQDAGQVRAKLDGDRRIFALTAAGKTAATAFAAAAAETDEPVETQIQWLPTWIDLRGSLATSASRLAKVSAEAARYGSKEQQEQAAEAIDEATKKIHAILGSS